MAQKPFRRFGAADGIAGRIAKSIFFLIFAGIACFPLVMMGRDTTAAWATRSWTPTPCRILTSRIAVDPDRNTPFTLTITYRYTVGGGVHDGDRWTLKPDRSDDYTELQRIADAYPRGGDRTCYVNPADASQAVLRQASLTGGFAILFPLPFLAVGLAGLWFTWRRRKPDSTPLSRSEQQQKLARAAPMIFGLIFTLLGAAFLIPFFILPMQRSLAAKRWVRTPCVIEYSRVRRHTGDKGGSTYSVDVLYRYRFKGKTYHSNRYSFLTGSSSGRGAKQHVVDSYRPRQRARCWVNPDDPYQAVLTRKMTSDIYFGLIPAVFIVIGLGITFASWRSRNRIINPTPTNADDEDNRPDWLPDHKGDGTTPVVLHSFSAAGKITVLALIALIWNGSVGFIFSDVARGYRRGDMDIGMALFSIPFVLVGVGVVGAIIYQLLALRNPRPILTVANDAVPPGDALDVAWDFIGRVERIRACRIELVGYEEVRYAAGKNSTKTQYRDFLTLTLLDTTDPQQIRHGAASVTIPPGAMHSFDAPNNKIIWELRVHGSIPRWPDVKQTFTVVVLPPQTQPAGAAR